nr:SLAP domain-containing protein [Lactobacillus crispatus]
MKKNLRIVSAAAAALLAVAPVAATSFVAPASTVSAAVQKPTADYTVPGTITLDRGTNTQFSVKLSQDQEEGIAAAFSKKVSDIKSIVVSSATAPDTTGSFYQVLTVTFNDNSTKTVLTTAKFASQQGTPYFYNIKDNTVIDNGSTVNLDKVANGFSASYLLNEIRDNYACKTSDASGSKAEMTTTASDVESQLVAQGLKRASNGDFDYPANGFNLKLTAKSENGNTASFTVRINASVNYNAPIFVVGNTLYFNQSQVSGVISDTKDSKVIVNNKLNTKYIEGLVTAYVQSAYGNKPNEFVSTKADLDRVNANPATKIQQLSESSLKFDYTKVNTSVAGVYPVTVTATNPAGYTSKITLYVAVLGNPEKAPQEYVKADNTKVYNINGNVVTEAKATLAKGAAVYTFGKVTVNGVEYTRIKDANGNELFVKSSDLTATKPDTTVPSQPKNIMHNAYYYDKDAKRVGTDKLTRYNSVNVAMSTTTIKGKAYYEVIENGKATGKFINADNIDGTKRTLKHNAYVYKTSKKRANKVVLKKGKEVTTYGGTYTFKNGKQYYKIGNNTDKTYVKASNF